MEVTEYTTSSASVAVGCLPASYSNASIYEVGNISRPPCIPEYSEKMRLKGILSNIITALIAVIMIGIGCSVEVDKITKHLKKPTGIVTGFLCQFLLMPLVAYAWAKIFVMEDVETLSLLIVGASPGGTLSNIVSYWVGGDMELSAVMTTASVALSFATFPLLLFIYSELIVVDSVVVPYSAIGITVALIVVPISMGAFLRYKSPNTAKKVLKIFSIVGIFAVIGVACYSIYLFNEFWFFQTGHIIAAVFYPACGMALGYAIPSVVGWLAPSLYQTSSQKRTISVETGIQNSQLATSVIHLSNWSLEITGRATVIPLMYAISQISWSLLYVGAYQGIHYAKTGKFRKNSSINGPLDGSSQNTKTTDIENPAFDPTE